MDGPWVYRLRDLGEPALADSSPVRRPTVPLLTRSAERHLGVIDTGSPVSVTSIGMLRRAGIDVESDPLMEVPLGLGGRFDRVPVFGLSLGLLSPDLSTIEEWSLTNRVPPRLELRLRRSARSARLVRHVHDHVR